MPFGAAESIFAHEILTEKICMLDHFSLYAEQCQDLALKQMIMHHMQTAMGSYNEMVSYTHDYRGTPSRMAPMNASPEAVQYGLNNPQPVSPTMQGNRMNDMQIATAVLLSHKNSAKNHMAAALECADPNVRQMMMNGSVTCCNQAYETFMYMNQRGVYQVPTLNDHTAKTFLHHYQPVQGNGMMAMSQPGPNGYQRNPFLM
jgi:spore coat protein CotF